MTHFRWLVFPSLLVAVAIACFAQPSRIKSRIDNSRRVTLRGRVHPLANARNDAGVLAGSFPLSLTLELKPSADQQSGLDQLTRQQQDPTSANFHRWLTPEEYADRFGSSAADVTQIRDWLQAQGFTVTQVGRGRTYISFSGTAAQVQAAFATSLHRYRVNGEMHYANSSDPQIPAALSGMVAGIRGLHDFRPKPHLRKAPQPQYSSTPGIYHLGPDDFAAIYDIAPIYAAGINGTGQSIAILGQTQLYNSGSDITAFWNKFGIANAKLTQKRVTYRPNPGVVEGDVDEASLDVEWASAVARNATIVYVYADNVWDSALYTVDQNLAPVISMSYGICESYDLVDLPSNRLLVQRANAQGQTWLAAAGDTGASDCDYGGVVAEGGLEVDAPASIPEVTAMGGTQFNEGSGSYWNAANGTAKGYIPEVTWNESALSGSLLGTGGGASVFFPQPSWQTTGGAPNDGVRHVPDVSFSSSVFHDSYYIYSEGSGGFVGGTSAATPTMAGVVALLNHYLVSAGVQAQPGLGNINPTLYRLAQSAPAAFHDITSGDNAVPCAFGSPKCSNGSQGFSAGAGYDSATGLGSVDVAELLRAWNTEAPTGSLVAASIDQNPVFQSVASASGNQWTYELTLTEEAGFATTLTDFTVDGVSYASQINSLFGTSQIPARKSIAATQTISLSGPKNVTFRFSGVDAGGLPWSTAMTVPFTGVQAHLKIAGVSNAATGQQAFAPGMILSVYGTGLGTAAQAASAIPLPYFMQGFEAFINDVETPLYYVGPNQVNLQIPYETATGVATLGLGNPYEYTEYNFTVSSAGPGIFMFADGAVNPSRSAKVGDTVPLFVTGEGRVSPNVATGNTPSPSTPLSNLPKPRQTVTVSVGGVPCEQPLPFVGIPSGLVGVTQINIKIPPGVPAGLQPVVVTVGTTQSPAANILIVP